MSEIVVLGGSGHAKVLISVLKKVGYTILGYIDPKEYGEVLGIHRLGGDEVLQMLRQKHPACCAAMGIGKIDADSSARLQLLSYLEELGYALPAIVSPHAFLNDDTKICTGTVVFDGAVVNSGTRVGRGCIINTNSTVEHDCLIGDNVHIASGAVLSGGINLGDHCMVGAGANIIQGVHIVAGCLIGAGTIVIRDLLEPGTYVGNPAHKI